MGLLNGALDSKYKKHIVSLRKPAIRAKSILKDAIQKSQKRFADQADKLEAGEEKNVVLKKLHKVTEDLQILENLSEDDIIEFALTTTQKVMALASNPRLPKEVRLKARVASHKPLSSHLARVRSLVEAGSDQSESEEETETAEDAAVKLDRISMNNQIVKMRGVIKQAKVHLIHKFTRTVKLLQNSKCKEEKKVKFQRKAERFVKKIKHIKEVEADDVSRFALSTKTEDVEKLLLDVKMPMKSQAMAIITLHKLVAASVDDYRKRFPDWSTTVSSVLKKKKKKRKVNVETVSGASKKMKDSLSESGSEGEEHEKSDSENDGRCNVSNSDNEEESANSRSENEEENDSERDSGENSVSNEEENSETDEEDETDKEEKTENNLESEDEDNEILSEFEEQINDSKADIKKSIAKNTAVKSLKRHLKQPNPQPPMKKPTVTKAISQKKSNKVVKKNEEGKEGDKHPLKTPEKPKAAKEKPKVVDPFFMTTTNEEYLTSQAPTVGDDKDSNWKSKSDDYSQTRYNSFSNLNSRNQRSSREDNWNNRKQNKFSDREPHQHPKPFAQRSEKPFSNNGVEPFNIFTNRKERRKALQQPAQEEKVEKLHPSWEAKKKQTSIASFQGKKITFD